MDDTKGDNESVSRKVTVRDTDEEVDNDQTDNNDGDDERNKVDDGDNEAHEKTTVEEEIADTDETNDVADETNDDDVKHNEEEERDENEAAVEDGEAEQDAAGLDNKPEESAAIDAEDNREAEVHESEPSVHEDDDAVEQDKTEEQNEDATAEEEGREGEDEGEKEVAAEEEDQMVNKTAESLEEDNSEQNGSRDITEEDATRCRLMFDKKAINGRLNLQGFKTVFRVLGEIISSEEAGRMFEDGDRDDDDTLDFEEFFRLYAKFRQEEQTRREVILDSLDKLFLCGSGGTIELKKVQQLLLQLQQPGLDRLVREKSDLGVDEVKQMVKSLDKQGNGFISKEEFVNIMCQHLEI